MGQNVDRMIQDFQRQAGIEPATEERAKILQQITETAQELIQVSTLERSGVRDGDGCWHGTDPVEVLLDKLCKLRIEWLGQSCEPSAETTSEELFG